MIYGAGATSGISKWEKINLVHRQYEFVSNLCFGLMLATRLVIGRVYKKLDEEMKLLWNKDLKLNTVHISDVVRACWHLARWYDENDIATRKDRKISFNLADKQDTGQCEPNVVGFGLLFISLTLIMHCHPTFSSF